MQKILIGFVVVFSLVLGGFILFDYLTEPEYVPLFPLPVPQEHQYYEDFSPREFQLDKPFGNSEIIEWPTPASTTQPSTTLENPLK